MPQMPWRRSFQTERPCLLPHRELSSIKLSGFYRNRSTIVKRRENAYILSAYRDQSCSYAGPGALSLYFWASQQLFISIQPSHLFHEALRCVSLPPHLAAFVNYDHRQKTLWGSRESRDLFEGTKRTKLQAQEAGWAAWCGVATGCGQRPLVRLCSP